MNVYFHLAPILLAKGSVIEPGNFGRIITLVGEPHRLFRRESIYEATRQSRFRERPSRLNCVFCYPTKGEAEIGRSIAGYAWSLLYEVESDDAEPFFADANEIQHSDLPAFDANRIANYWQGRKPAPGQRAPVFQEVLVRTPVTIRARLV